MAFCNEIDECHYRGWITWLNLEDRQWHSGHSSVIRTICDSTIEDAEAKVAQTAKREFSGLSMNTCH